MNCKTCGKEIKETDSFCPNCGEKIMKDIKDDKKKKVRLYFLFVIEFLVIAILVSRISNVTSELTKTSRKIDSNEFQSIMESKEYRTEKITSKNKYFKEYIVAKNSGNLDVGNKNSDVTFNYVVANNDYAENAFYSAKNQIDRNKNGGFYSTTSVNFKNYNYYTISDGAKYHVLARKENIIILGEGSIKSKNEINQIITELDFNFSISPSFSYYFIVLVLLIIALMQITLWKIFKKAGIKPWKSLIPLYSLYYLFKIAYNNGWYILLLFIPIINIFTSCLLYYKLARVFGKSKLFAICSVPFFLITTQIIAFDNSKYIGGN